jgi:hypothetical protein
MVDWKLYIDSPQKRALDLCGGSFDKGDGGASWMISGVGVGSGNGYGSNRRPGDGFGGGGFDYGWDNTDDYEWESGSGGSPKLWV